MTPLHSTSTSTSHLTVVTLAAVLGFVILRVAARIHTDQHPRLSSLNYAVDAVARVMAWAYLAGALFLGTLLTLRFLQ